MSPVRIAFVIVTYILFGILFSEGWIRVRDRVADWLWGIQVDQGIDVDELDRPTKGSGEL